MMISHKPFLVFFDFSTCYTSLEPPLQDGGVKILATCFGSQVLAHALGGRAGPNPSRKFVLQREDNVRVGDALKARADYKAAAEMFPPMAEGRLAVYQSHGDCVVELPPGAEVGSVDDRIISISGDKGDA